MVITLLLCMLASGFAYKKCSSSERSNEKRKLYVATCDTKSRHKLSNALKGWNITGQYLANQGVEMVNVCAFENWKSYEFLTKPIFYLKYIKSIIQRNQFGSNVDASRSDLSYLMLTDSDVFWSVTDVNLIWDKYDCVRGNKSIVMSTEMSCWIGNYCTREDIAKYYSNIADIPSYSPFLNSGAVMGKLGDIKILLEHVIKHNQSYFAEFYTNKFDDQYAYTHYALKIATQKVALDYHQDLFSSIPIHVLTGYNSSFICKTRNQTIEMNCIDSTSDLYKNGFFYINTTMCILQRRLWKNMPLFIELNTLSYNPILWHGNGVGKVIYQKLSKKIISCFMRL